MYIEIETTKKQQLLYFFSTQILEVSIIFRFIYINEKLKQ